MDQKTDSKVKSAEFSAVVIRVDGTREELGVVSYYHKNPLMRGWFKLKQLIKRLTK